jgi:hypothetical protein
MKASVTSRRRCRLDHGILWIGVVGFLLHALSLFRWQVSVEIGTQDEVQAAMKADFTNTVTTREPQPVVETKETSSDNTDTSHKTPAPPFYTASTRKALSRGVDLYENVCLKQRPNRHLDFRTYVVHNNTSQPALQASMLTNDVTARPNFFDWILKSNSYPLARFDKDVEAGEFLHEPTLLTFDIFHNPGHCLSDLVWSLAVDRYDRRGGNITTGTSTISDDEAPFYVNYIYGDRDSLDPTQYPLAHDWCWHFLQAAGFVGSKPLPVDTRHGRPVCFRHLLVPTFSQFRFPLQDVHQVASLKRYPFLWNFMRTHDFVRDSGRPDHWSYPVAALLEVRRRATAALGLMSKPWDRNEQTLQRLLPILFLDRRGSARRQWLNAEEVQARLEHDYNVRVIIWSETVSDSNRNNSWNNLTFVEQATLVNSYAHIVMVHSGSQANLIFGRPGTKVVELACLNPGNPQADSTVVTPPNVTTNREAWEGPMGWYSAFTRPLGMAHSILSDTLACEGGAPGSRRHDAGTITAEVDGTVRFLATRLELPVRVAD